MSKIKELSKIIFLILILILISHIEIKAAFFSDQMEKFIKDGKEVTVLIEEGIRDITITPEDTVILNRGDDNGFIELQGSNSYSLNIETRVKEYYKVQVFATYNRQRADEIWLDMVKLGYQEVRVIKEEDWYKVRFGYFEEKNDTEEVIKVLKEHGWEAWPVIIKEQLAEKIYVYDMQREELFTGSSISVSGSLIFKDNIYNGRSYFQINKEGIKFLHRTKLEVLLAGIVQSVFKEIDSSSSLDPEQMDEFIKAYSIALRTNILYNTIYEEDYIINPNFKGIADKEFLDKFTNTEGIILGNDDEFNGIYIPKIDLMRINIYKDLSEDIFDYKLLLAELYNYDIIDLKKINYKETVVDAEIEWGLRYKEIRQLNWQGPVVYTLLELDLNSKNFYLEAVLANEQINGLQDLGKMLKEKGVLAGINGGYFHYSGRPLGLIYKEDNIIAEPVKNRTALLLTEDNQVIFDRVTWQGQLDTIYNQININGVNRKPGNDQIVIFNNYYGKYAPLIKAGMIEIVVVDDFVKEINRLDDSPGKNEPSYIPENAYIIQAHGRKVQEFNQIEWGDFIHFNNFFTPDFKELNIKMAIAAGPRLLKNGELFISSDEEEFQPDIAYGRAPRSAVGISSNNSLVFLTVDGRQPEHSVGITLEQLAKFMKEYNIIDGMNLDGGSSARMIVRGFTMNSPSAERLISNGILIGKKKPLK